MTDLMRIAAALEAIERHLHSLTPLGREQALARAFHQHRERAEAELKLMTPPPLTLTRRAAAQAFAEVCGDADPTSKANWERVANEARARARGWGEHRVALLREWIAQQWPEGNDTNTSAPTR